MTHEERPPYERLSELLRGVPEEEKEAAAERFIGYLEILIAIADEAEAAGNPITPQTEPQESKSDVTCPRCMGSH